MKTAVKKTATHNTHRFLRDLVAIPSVNPALMPPNDPRAGENKVADFLAATAAKAGLDIEFSEAAPGRSSILARYVPPKRPRQHILLAPHLDTVGDANMPKSLFDPRVRNGRLYGRGACDTKGSVAAMLMALIQMLKSGRRPEETAITFAGLVDEEVGQKGSRALIKSGIKSDFAIVGEPTRLNVVTAHKGDLWLRLETKGKAAHGARPELGKNAVHAMAKVIDVIETQYAAELRKRKHPLLGHATVNVGSVVGGTQPNIVPDHCEISIDRRTLPGETESGVRKEIKALLEKNRCVARLINTKDAPCPPMETDPKQPLVRRLLEAVGRRYPIGVDFFCDAAVLAGGGIPSVVFGPGDIAQAHTADEWISLREVDDATERLCRFLRSLP